MQKDLYLVVVSILEGRNFPNRSKFQIVSECRFDGELLCTDPVEHTSSPNFTTELAWELDKKALHQHRMQRTPIKLQCYAVNISNGVREQIGYVLLDLRLAQQKTQGAKWYNLLSSKYSRMKPAIKIGMALEDDHPSQENAFKAREAPPRIEKLTGSPKKEIIPVLEKDEGYFQIGDPKYCKDMFVLSVTVAFAANLEQLISSDKMLAKANTEFFFYYTLLGNDVANDPFSNLLNPDFLPERASVRLRSSPLALRSYFSQPCGNLQIHLCSDDHSFGSADIPLSALFKEPSKDFNLKPAVIEDAFIIIPTGSTQAGASAKVGVSICLKREDMVPMPAGEKAPSRPQFEDERKSAEYGAAVELELWKEQQEHDFEHKLREKEIAHMQNLAREWQKRDKEREAMLAKTLSEYGQLETKLRKSLTDVEAREKQVRHNEQELLRLRNEVQREREQLLSQAKESGARMKEDCVRQVQLERSRISDLEDDKAKLKSRLNDADRRYATLEQKFEAFKLQQTNMPEVRVQSELQLLTLEKNELERKLETVSKSKMHYKQQWGRALKELARLKQKEQERAMATLRRQQDELQMMRSRYMADEERDANSRGQKELLEIRQELDRIKAKDQSVEKRADIGIAMALPNENSDPLIRPSDASEEHVARLIEERDTLLRTGVYSKQDRIIEELDRQIRETIAKRTMSS